MILEVCDQSGSDLERLFWHRDVFEKNRYQYIRSHAKQKKGESNDSWFETYQTITNKLRPNAIKDELSGLLTLFTNHRFFSYEKEQRWFITDDPSSPQWGQPWLVFDELTTGTVLSNSVGEEVPKVPVREYGSAHRDVIGEDIQLPEDIDQLFNLYFELDSGRKEDFHAACTLYNQALEPTFHKASLSLVAAVMAIEALVDGNKELSGIKQRNQLSPTEVCLEWIIRILKKWRYKGEGTSKRCPECDAENSLGKCSRCGLPRHRTTTRFKQFITEYGSQEQIKFAGSLYSTRSNLAHGGLLRDDLHDSGFYSGDKDEEQMFRRQSLVLVRVAILNWLIHSGKME